MSADMLTLRTRPRSPPPQLQIENHSSDDNDHGDDENERPRTAPRPRLNGNGFSGINRSNTSLFAVNSRNASRQPSPAPPQGRPGLQRAKSDFGPRREEVNRGGEEAETKEGEWGLRHGFETQLESEEYNRLLESVRTLTVC